MNLCNSGPSRISVAQESTADVFNHLPNPIVFFVIMDFLLRGPPKPQTPAGTKMVLLPLQKCKHCPSLQRATSLCLMVLQPCCLCSSLTMPFMSTASSSSACSTLASLRQCQAETRGGETPDLFICGSYYKWCSRIIFCLLPIFPSRRQTS